MTQSPTTRSINPELVQSKSPLIATSEGPAASVTATDSLPRDLQRCLIALSDAFRFSQQENKSDANQENRTVVYMLQEDNFFKPALVEPFGVFRGNALTAEDSHPHRLKLGRLADEISYANSEDMYIGKFFQGLGGWKTFEKAERDSNPNHIATFMGLVLKTNRCFFGSHDNPSLTLGQELPGRIVWTVDEKNRYRLCILAFSGDTSIPCLRWRQPWYLDCQRWVCGPVALDFPMDIVVLIQTFRSMTFDEAVRLCAMRETLGLVNVIPPVPRQAIGSHKSVTLTPPAPITSRSEPDNAKLEQSEITEIQPCDMSFSFTSIDYDTSYSFEANVRVLNRIVPIIRLLTRLRASEIEKARTSGKIICTMNGKPVALPAVPLRVLLRSLYDIIHKDLAAVQQNATVRVSAMQAINLMKQGAFAGINWKVPAMLVALKSKFDLFERLEPVEAPDQFGTTLRDYQLRGLAWLQLSARTGFGGILADDRGLGKTVQMLAHICQEKENGLLESPFLIVVPSGHEKDWLYAATRFAAQLNAAAAVNIAGLKKLKTADFDIVVVPYSLLADKHLHSVETWTGVVLDEAQAIKSLAPDALSHASRIRAQQRFCLMGEPILDALEEFWPQFNFLNPELFDDLRSFRSLINPSSTKLVSDPDLQFDTKCFASAFVLRRTTAEVRAELPDLTSIVRKIKLDESHMELYKLTCAQVKKTLDAHITTYGIERSQILIQDSLNDLRALCCDPRLLKLESAQSHRLNSRFESVLEIASKYVEKGKRVIVFTHFRQMIRCIGDSLHANGLAFETLTDRTKDWHSPLQIFNSSMVSILLVSLKQFDPALYASAADVVIHFDPWLDLECFDQTICAHPIVNRNQFEFKLIATGTIEERMTDLQNRKRAMACGECVESTTIIGESDLEFLLAVK